MRCFRGMRRGPRPCRAGEKDRSVTGSSYHRGVFMRLKDQVAVITGGAQGIGKSIAMLFASEGAKLVLSDIDEGMVQATAAQIGKEKNVETLGVKGNVSQIGDCEKLVDASLDKFSRIDILINNAGITRDNLLMRMS